MEGSGFELPVRGSGEAGCRPFSLRRLLRTGRRTGRRAAVQLAGTDMLDVLLRLRGSSGNQRRMKRGLAIVQVALRHDAEISGVPPDRCSRAKPLRDRVRASVCTPMQRPPK